MKFTAIAFSQSLLLVTSFITSVPLLLTCTASSAATNTTTSNDQIKARWYRYYNSNGTPNLSSVITQEHVKNGYEALNSSMQVIKRVPPFSPESYERAKSERERLEAKRQDDRNLVATHVSSVQATAKRDQLLLDMAGRAQYLGTQLAAIQMELATDVAAAAAYERRQQTVPTAVSQRMADKRTQIEQMQNNINALQKRQDDVKAQYGQIISRLQYLESHRNLLTVPK
jgi:chromosome segregation ATPase